VNVRATATSGFAHPAQWQSVSNPVNRHKPPRMPNPPTRTPTRVTGYYLFYGGAPYWVPAGGDEAGDQEAVDQGDADQSGGDQTDAPSRQNQSQRNAMLAQQNSGGQQAGQDSDAAQNAAEQEAQAPLPDEGEFTLVMTDGTWIQAVAFTHSNDKIVYITAAGSRYTIAASELDADSTLRVNQERGTPLQSPL
jgi:hypothetical protein